MTIKEQLNIDIKKALREKDELILSVLRMLNSAIHNKEIEKRSKLSKEEKDLEKLKEESKLTEEEILKTIFSEAKKRNDSIEAFAKGGRDDLVEKEKKELEILKKYLPEQMSRDKIIEEAKKAIKETSAEGIKDIGKVMSVLMPILNGRANGTTVSDIVKELLK